MPRKRKKRVLSPAPTTTTTTKPKRKKHVPSLQVMMKVLNQKELESLREKATRYSMSMSDYLRERAGLDAVRRPIGRPARKFPCPVCAVVVTQTEYPKHMKEAHA